MKQEAKKKQIAYGISGFRTPSDLTIVEEVYTHTNITMNEGASAFNVDYRIYEVSIGKGHKPRFVITKNSPINHYILGDHEVVFTEVHEEDLREVLSECDPHFLRKVLCKKLGVSTTKGKGQDKEPKDGQELKDDIVKWYGGVHSSSYFYMPSLTVPFQELRDKGNVIEKCKEILRAGLEKDEDIDLILLSTLPEPNPKTANPRELMPYAPHSIIISRTKAGKSYSANKITSEGNAQNPSIAGLIGFADARDKTEGFLHNRVKPTIIEEVQEQKEENVWGQLLNYAEQGEANVVRGKRVIVRGFSPLVFLGNPKENEETSVDLQSYLMAKKFRDFIIRISANTKAWGSRIGCVYFNPESKSVKGKPDDYETQKKGDMILRVYAEGYRDEFLQAFRHKKVQEWLVSPINPEYKKRLRELERNAQDRLVREFIEGLQDGIKHLKGMALRLAWLDVGLSTLLNKERENTQEANYAETSFRDFQALLLKADEYQEKIQRINLKSLSGILNLESTGVNLVLQEEELFSITPEYIKMAVCLALDADIERSSPVLLLEGEVERYSGIRDVFGQKDNRSYKYYSWSRVLEHLKQHHTSYSNVLRGYGLEYDSTNSSFIVVDGVSYMRGVEAWKRAVSKQKEGSDAGKGVKQENVALDALDAPSSAKKKKSGKSDGQQRQQGHQSTRKTVNHVLKHLQNHPNTPLKITDLLEEFGQTVTESALEVAKERGDAVENKVGEITWLN